MKRLIVDMDGVLADVYSNFIKLEKERYGFVTAPDGLAGAREEDAFPHYDEIVNSEGFFLTVPLIAGSVEALCTLNGIYDLRIVSSATEFPASLREKYDWLTRHFPFISWRQMTFGGNKDLINGDIMVDDNMFNLDPFEGEKILFTQPHNELLRPDGCTRAGNWNEVIKILAG